MDIDGVLERLALHGECMAYAHLQEREICGNFELQLDDLDTSYSMLFYSSLTICLHPVQSQLLRLLCLTSTLPRMIIHMHRLLCFPLILALSRPYVTRLTWTQQDHG
jgi:hypothetical protein